MLYQIKMPSMGATMEEGVIVSWRVKEGDQVNVGDTIADIESDKSMFEYESPSGGVVRKIIAKQGQTCPVQSLIAIIGDVDEEIPADWLTPAASQASVETPSVAAPAPAQSGVAAMPKAKGRTKASPRARKMAKQLGVDLETVTGTGPGGRIESSDVEQAAQAAPAAAGKDAIPLSPIRAAINRKVTQSKREIPHFYVSVMVDMTAAAAYRESRDKKVSFNAMLMKAIAAAVQAEPSLNVAITEAGFVPHESVNVGLAIETSEGVIIAVVDNVDQGDDVELTTRIDAVVETVRRGDMQAIKTHGACMTISNVGATRTDLFIPIIHPGEAAVFGISSIADRPVVVDGEVVACRTMGVTFCVDHRISDGAVAAKFLAAVAGYLESLQA